MTLPALTPELNVSNLERSLDFYLNVLGFSIVFERKEERFAAISLDGAYLMLDEMKEFHAVTQEEFLEKRAWRTAQLEYPYGRGLNFLITVKDINKLYERLVENNYPIKMPLEKRWYRVENEMLGVQQFMVMDPDGFLLRFDCLTEKKPV